MTVSLHTGVCVVGGGPAGAAIAIRLAQLGHPVVLAERRRRPRRRLGELLSPGVSTQLDLLGAREAIARAGFPTCHRALVRWQRGVEEMREVAGSPGLLVDRGRFDALLLDTARAHGVRVLQPATVGNRRRNASGWSLDIETGDGALHLDADFVAVATGRTASPRAGRQVIGCPTLALYADWRGAELPREPRIEAGDDTWYWGMPLAGGGYCTMAFVDITWLKRRRAEPLEGIFTGLIAGSQLLEGCRGAELAGPVRAADATAYLDDAPIEPGCIKVGEAAIALDPLSSSGVQRSVQSALAGAVVVNTLLRRPGEGAAVSFYHDSLASAAARHQRWAAGFYQRASVGRDSRFWRDRSASVGSESEPSAPRRSPDPELPVALAAEAELIATPCIVGDFVALRSALHHPRLDEPVAFVSGYELAPLLQKLVPGMTIRDVIGCWSNCIATGAAALIVGWLLHAGVLVSDLRLSV